MSTVQGCGGGAATMFAMAKLMIAEDRAAAADRERQAEQAERAELAEGTKQASELHDAASQTMQGAFVSGALTAVGGLAVIRLGAELRIGDRENAAEVAEANDIVNARIKGAGALESLAVPAGKAFDAGAEHDRANAAEHEARARAHGHEAEKHHEAARTLRQADQELLAAVRDAAQSEHAGLMAILSAR